MKTKLFIIIGAIGMLTQLSARVVRLSATESDRSRTFNTRLTEPITHRPFRDLISTAHNQHQPFRLEEVVTNQAGALHYTYFGIETLTHNLHPAGRLLNPANGQPIIRINHYRFDSPRHIVFDGTDHFATAHHASHTTPYLTPPQEEAARLATFDQALHAMLDQK